MNEEEKKELVSFISEAAPMAETVFMDPCEAVFEECVKMNCYYCGKYGHNWRCPPNLPDIDYQKMFSEFDEGMFVIFTYKIKDKMQYESIRNESSVTLHKVLLQIEKWMWNHDRPTAVSFGAGSCKLCKGGCGKDRCNNPYMSRSPLEAVGVNLIKTAQKYGVQIHFPADNKLMRAGLVMWQDPILESCGRKRKQ